VATTPGSTSERGARIGLGLALALMVLAPAIPRLTGWDVRARTHPEGTFPPLNALWEPHLGLTSLPALALAVLGWRYASTLAATLTWGRLLLVSYAAALAWILALAWIGPIGIGDVLGHRIEILPVAREIDDVGATLREFVSRVPYSATPDNWPTHVAGHPPGALLFYVGLVRIGLGGDLAAGLVVTAIGATTTTAVLVTLRVLGAEAAARRAAPFLVLGPMAVFMGVSNDAMFAAVAAWGLAALALAATRVGRARVGGSVLAGLLLGWLVMLSYGLPLVGLLAIALLVAARSWKPLPIAAATALAVVLAFVPAGFVWWEALPVLRERYYDGVAGIRPASYWVWGNLAALCFSAGPMIGAGLGRLAVLRADADRVVRLLATGALAAVVVADLSFMSKAEVERIWLPFAPWLLLSVALLPERWRRWGLAGQLVVALLVQHLLDTRW
jgi:hypothetical protein